MENIAVVSNENETLGVFMIARYKRQLEHCKSSCLFTNTLKSAECKRYRSNAATFCMVVFHQVLFLCQEHRQRTLYVEKRNYIICLPP
jgi:hypothetical protein